MIFGGSDSQATHFNDVTIYKKCEEGRISAFKSENTKGDIPMLRQSHSAVAYGKYMLLFGGTMFSLKDEDSCAYNDLYLFDTGEKMCGCYLSLLLSLLVDRCLYSQQKHTHGIMWEKQALKWLREDLTVWELFLAT